MSLTETINKIDNQTLTYLPAVFAGVHAAEQSSASGSIKKQAVLDGIQAGAKLGEGLGPNVAAISGLIDLVVSIWNALGVFKKKPQAAQA